MSRGADKKKWYHFTIFTIIGFFLSCMIVCFLFVDEPVISWLQRNSINFEDTILGDAFKQLGKVFPIVWLLLFWVWVTGRHRTAVIGILALIITIPAVWSIKATVRRLRPHDVVRTSAETETDRNLPKKWSLPSGDTASVFAIGTVLASSAEWPWIIGIALGCGGIGVLRVVDLAHYPSDVCAGAAVGIFCGWAALRIRNKNPKIEDIFAGHEQALSSIGFFLVPALVWIFQGPKKLNILLTFYVPVAAAIFIARWKGNLPDRNERLGIAHIDQIRDHSNRLFRWRGFLPLLIIPLFLMILRNFTYPENSHLLDLLWEFFCFAIALSGLGIRIYTAGHASAWTSGIAAGGLRQQELNTTGMYSVVRHPLYMGNLIIWVGIILFVRSVPLAVFSILSFFLYYERIIITEETFLSQKFGSAFAQWAEKTPILIPRFKLWHRSAYPFSWRAVLAREYPVFFAITAVFTAIEVLGDRFYEGKWQLDWIWVAIFCVGLSTFVILGTLKKLGITGRH